LLVEDQTALRHLMRMQLGDLGYDVIEADDPQHAITLARERRFDLLLTDVIMPEMNGAELARKIRELHAGARVLFVTGWADDAMMAEAHREAPLLAKPFTSTDLSRAVESALR
jgi:CheY-like chemotaxis protein